jgi:hypothetical protein
MFRTSLLLAALFFFVTHTSVAQEKKHKINYEKEGYEKAEVIHYKVEGCGFLIELIDKEKTKLAPANLPEEFKKDKEKVWVKYTIAKKQLKGGCMAGKQAEIIEIKKRR